jgi:hypothetical protein
LRVSLLKIIAVYAAYCLDTAVRAVKSVFKKKDGKEKENAADCGIDNNNGE